MSDTLSPLPCHAPSRALGVALLALCVLAGCSTAPPRGATVPARVRPGASGDPRPEHAAPDAAAEAVEPPGRDGPPRVVPPHLDQVPDAEPTLEPIRVGGPNKVYEVNGRVYTPETRDTPLTERGLASWYGRQFHGRRTASGELYDMYAMSAAHRTLPIPSYARVRNPANGREVVVRINDRGPFHPDRILDLSYTAALKLGLLRGVAPVEVRRITAEDIRTGAWRHGETGSLAAATAPATTPATAQSTSPAAAPVVASVTSALAAPDAAPVAGPDPGASATDTSAPPSAVAVTLPGPAPAAAAMLDRPAAPVAPIADAASDRAFTRTARGFWVQLGAFRVREGAEAFRQRIHAEANWLAPLLAVFGDAAALGQAVMYRLQAGPYPSREEARRAAERAQATLKLTPLIVERR